ncbi:MULTISPECIES: polyhydroxyalkanoate synthesis repressor PhaR [Pseudomonas]|jgi:polyhydroxyalkanoate synthesis repressor PhaR|uniref:polyhydroxyalkanoate synthesis repressor PhaR n=1 Tax=Pseudomonas TaxID=286 RepID=UPI000D8F97A7|nr:MULTISPECIES: polyhydroxyalkanoate synthesis repressor PhaR [Pseudomonas]MDP9689451.1 polyhydroxyalkanoate synthesis repressor PhaR [Pseudomonas mohnii]MBD0678343.1 polyhydroxyalkanoate synthesis repressor PhaR [Pseudomonas sp. PSB11]MCK8684852.1 polyhydroxyalkanoate synthesis repressor PhaR [Pseudomonas umsongensis]MDI3392537.1 polyhydroxyalkanoate synthesis repressor PhaR [Pseudomonas sp. V98_8]NWL19246.1 polyhydroxyalkanoate synthesis repressor PhaR [Pseudomonas umsongensis]
MTENSRNTTRLIKKYPNRRLYDTHTSSHLTLADIRQLVVDRIPFEVVDAKTGENLTRSILLQVILEAESGGQPIFSSEMLMGIIQFYGPYQSVLGSYLDKSIQTVIDIQSQTGAQSSETWSAFMHQQAPVMQDLMRQYVDQSKALYMNTQNLFGMFGAVPPGKPGADGGPKKNGDGE